MVAALKKIKSLLNESIAVSTLLFEDDENIPQERDLIEELELEWDARISLVRCAVHSFQLAIADIFDKADPNLKCITEVVRHLRQIKYKSFVEVQQLALPPLWSPTRWGGKYKMLSSILKQEAKFVELGTQYSEMCLGKDDWRFIKDYVDATRPLYHCTKVMQADHYPLSQFYIDWLVAIQEVSMLKGNPFSNALVSTCTNRLERLRNNMAFKASLYLDPRLNFLDTTVFESTNEKAEIQNFIADTW
ncbi:uncharacterized protein LOC129779530 [Toxorhynchites rutilus septentrionalis]|uniref:uncharacterized protein LOC129779530 n=1 Tax=Toxorhynchites rutilus septentrionalis TaxID=329112 RepID=UPI00247B03D8|nr:uncharacterized protein LOC129779530 [Toxorhynchites rutilus septentrionalis]